MFQLWNRLLTIIFQCFKGVPYLRKKIFEFPDAGAPDTEYRASWSCSCLACHNERNSYQDFERWQSNYSDGYHTLIEYLLTVSGNFCYASVTKRNTDVEGETPLTQVVHVFLTAWWWSTFWTTVTGQEKCQVYDLPFTCLASNSYACFVSGDGFRLQECISSWDAWQYRKCYAGRARNSVDSWMNVLNDVHKWSELRNVRQNVGRNESMTSYQNEWKSIDTATHEVIYQTDAYLILFHSGMLESEQNRRKRQLLAVGRRISQMISFL